MKLVITTQFIENYGTPEEPRWKYKWGETYIVKDYEYQDDDKFAEDIGTLAKFIEFSNSMAQEYIIGYEIVDDEWMSHDEKIQIEFGEGIEYYDTVLTLEGEMTKKFLGFDGHLYEHRWDANGDYTKAVVG